MNRYRFEYHEDSREFLVYLDINGSDEVLIGRVGLATAQSTNNLYAWADRQAALLGLASETPP